MHVKSMIAGMVAILPLGSDRKKIQVFQKKKKFFLNQVLEKTCSLLTLDLTGMGTGKEKIA